MDSKFQFRDASQPPTTAGEWLLLEPQKQLYLVLWSPTTARVIAPRRLSIGPNPTEASKPLPIWRGTEISNPFPSSGESGELVYCAVRSRDERWPGEVPARAEPQARFSVGNASLDYQRSASSTCFGSPECRRVLPGWSQ